MDHYRSKGKGLDQRPPWSEWTWDDRGYWYTSRTGSNGLTEYHYRSPEPENRAATPRTPGPTGFSVTPNQQSTYSPPVETSNNSYTTSQTRNLGGLDQDTTPTPSYPSPAPINNYYDPSNTTNRNYGTVPTTNTSIETWPTYPSTNKATWTSTRNVAPASIETITNAFGSMSVTNPRAPPPGAFNSQVSKQLPINTKHIVRAPNSGNTETLDSRYEVHGGYEQDKFWKVGRVFMMLWTEPAAQSKVPEGGGTRNGSHFSTTYLGEIAYSEIRRFVVVSKGHGSSICCPIHTYSKQATLKPNLPAPQQHTIIYTTTESPGELSWLAVNGQLVAENLTKLPIQVISERDVNDPDGQLHKLSRLNYNKVYTVEHYVRVLNIGMVAETSISTLLYDSGWPNRPASEQRPRKVPPKKSPGQSSSHHKKDHGSHKHHKSSYN